MFLENPIKLAVSILSIIIAITLLFLLKRKDYNLKIKMLLIYLHLFFLSLPLILFSYSISCDMGLLNGIIAHCATAVTKAFIYTIPLAIILVAISGYIIIPALYIKTSKHIKSKDIKSFIKIHSRKLKIKTPRVYSLNISKPTAFSFSNIKSAIFLSLGLTNLLSKKELESVLLHELHHIKNRSAIFKFSTMLIKFSPLSAFTTFSKELTKEEMEADKFAIKVQKTNRYLNSAKKKMNEYNSYNR